MNRQPRRSTLFPYTTLFRSAPTVTIPAGGSSTVACPSAAVAPTPPVVTDNCGRTITPSAPVISPDPPCAGTKTYTYTYTADRKSAEKGKNADLSGRRIITKTTGGS